MYRLIKYDSKRVMIASKVVCWGCDCMTKLKGNTATLHVSPLATEERRKQIAETCKSLFEEVGK